MPKCAFIDISKTQVCSGDLRFPIAIYRRKITVPSDPFNGTDVDYGETFERLHDVFAAIQTPLGQTTFNDIGVSEIVSHIFYVRFLDDVSSENWIVYESDRYKIIKVTNFEGRSLFIKLECVLRGDEDKDATRA